MQELICAHVEGNLIREARPKDNRTDSECGAGTGKGAKKKQNVVEGNMCHHAQMQAPSACTEASMMKGIEGVHRLAVRL